MCETDASGAVLRESLFGPGVDRLEVLFASGPYPRFPLEDARGSVLSVVDLDGATKTSFSYTAFGETTQSGETFPYAFTGRRYLGELGLYDYRSRFYHPWLSRFLQRDPIGIWGDGVGLGNGYAYAGNNPISRLDPFGLQGEGQGTAPESPGRTGVVPTPPPEPKTAREGGDEEESCRGSWGSVAPCPPDKVFLALRVPGSSSGPTRSVRSR